jgi:hypothetical protein
MLYFCQNKAVRRKEIANMHFIREIFLRCANPVLAKIGLDQAFPSSSASESTGDFP